MKIFNTLLPALIVVAIFTSCTKDDAPVNANCKLTGFTMTWDTYRIHYDGDRIQNITDGLDSTIFEYAGNNNVLSRAIYNQQSPTPYITYKDAYQYDAAGNIVKETHYSGSMYGGSLFEGASIFYVYDGDHLASAKNYSSSMELLGHRRYTWTGDNISKVTAYNLTSTDSCFAYFEYDLTRENLLTKKYKNWRIFIPMRHEEYYDNYWSKNIVTKYTSCSNLVINFVSATNENGYITQTDITAPLLQQVYKYNYECE